MDRVIYEVEVPEADRLGHVDTPAGYRVMASDDAFCTVYGLFEGEWMQIANASCWWLVRHLLKQVGNPLTIESTDDLLDDLFHAVDCDGGSPELDHLVVRAHREIERLKLQLDVLALEDAINKKEQWWLNGDATGS